MELTNEQKDLLLQILDGARRECPLFNGSYDAVNGSEDFMDGIGTVFEWLYYLVSPDLSDQFFDEFTKGMAKSLDNK